jgi:hypothetical protein
VESAPRAYWLKASNAAPPFSTSAGTSPVSPHGNVVYPSALFGYIGSTGGSGRVEFVMPRVRVRHPEFGYVGSSTFRRVFLAFVVCGLIAGAISIPIFDSQPDLDPRDAMALAPAEALIAPKPAQPATQSDKRLGTSSAPKLDEGSIKPTCRESLGELLEGDCTSVRLVRVRPLKALNERPLIAAVPIGHRDDPTVLPVSPPMPIAVSPSLPVSPEEPKAIPPLTETSVVEATPADAAPAAEPSPPTSKPRARVHHAQDERRSRRREHYSYAASYGTRNSSSNISNTYVQSGYARVW